MSGRDPTRQRRSAARKEPIPRRRSGGVWRKLLALLVIVAVFILCVAIFFKVNEVRVQGNSLYSAQEVIDASGIQKGDNLMTLSKPVIAGKIMAALPYVEEVRIGRILPDKITLTVKESDAAFAVTDSAGGAWLMNSSGKILEQAPKSAATYPKITGVTAESPEVGKQIVCKQAENLNAALQVLSALEPTGFIAQVAEVNVEKTYDIVVWYQDKYEIRLGGTDELDYKIQYLTAVLGKMENYQTGVIDLTFEEEKVARFQPW